MEETMDMIPIAKLLDKNFLIPDYQRGYRWDKQQVNDMLNDIFEFMKKEKEAAEIYCLQPLVVSEQQGKEDTWRVVDGQQRLTTIYLILKYILKYINIENKEPYTIKYQTRDRSKDYSHDFLKGLSSSTEEDKAMDNVDFYHMYIVYKAIEEWFSIHKEECPKDVFGDTLLHSVNVIWYCVDNEQETKIFTRLNIGKIPLTDSELIKAMFLNRNNYADGNADEVKSRQHKLANEWYAIENTLQNDEFWLFIHNRFYKKPTRIDFILELMCRNDHYEIIKTLGENSYQKLKKDEDELKNRLGTVCLKKLLNDKDYIKNLLNNCKDTVKTEIKKQIYDYIYDENGNCQKEDLKKALLKGTQKPENFENKTQENKKKTLFEQFKNKMSDETKKAALRVVIGNDDYTGLINKCISGLGEMIYVCFKDNTELPKQLLGVYEFDLMMNDEHGIYRYFDQVFKNKNSGQTVDKLWKDIKYFFDIFREWYNDYKLYHYIGFLVAAKKYDAENFINECVKLWQSKEADFEYKTALTISKKDKESFINELKNEIVYKIMVDSNNDNPIDGKHNYFRDLINKETGEKIRKEIDPGSNNNFCDYLINTKFVENGYSKRCCVNILLLHNIETIIQYNDKLLDNNKYTVPYFTRFPFHLYNSDTWDVEHVRPNAGDDTNKEVQRLIYLILAKQYFADNLSEELEKNIDNYIKETENLKIDYNKYSNDEINDRIRNLEKELENKDKPSDDEKERLEKLKELDSLTYQRERKEKFNNIRDEIDKIGGEALDYNDRNKIWNYTLLDSSTNREYGNHVYPYKRAYIAAKEKGEALKYTIDLVKTKNAKVDGNEITVTKKNKDTETYKIVLKKETNEKAAPFVLQTTRNVFTKYYSDQITTMMQWTEKDAENYWKDMKEKLKFYFDKLNEKLNEA